MRIGFDLDGVLMTQDICLLQVMRCLEKHSNLPWARSWYYRTGKLQMDPKMFMNNEDEGFVITCREKGLESVTKIWCKRHIPILKLIQVYPKVKTGVGTFRAWCNGSALAKAEVINKLGLDVYFEDVPIIVRRLRELCPNTKILRYGGDVYEGLK